MADQETIRFYNENATRYAAAIEERSMMPHIERFTALLPPSAKLIDLGCGSGRDMKEFQKRGLPTVGLDASFELVRLARRTSGADVVVGELSELPFASSIFHGAWASASFLHLKDSEITTALREVDRVLKAGGVFFSSLKLGTGEERTADRRLFNYYAPNEWISRLGEAGFNVLSIKTDPVSSAGFGDSWISTIARKGV
ncbi:class I SAM-dependent DNA methyltransferase [Rhizobium leguminosarum]|uniref:class I SAM-dependent DNA methyltransferase n=1 Tax=Rhizobium leguminosarum TaxID=384 RepID=UPI00140F8962|nr:class I SAM-dependent methyltransferase [Rhizobium leguminosarum]QIO61589.1 class I SAM-dependent methyltransferase [Rhizobium leguminosarum bv. trifolii]